MPQIHVPVSEAQGQLTELVRRAEAGDEVVLTRHGHPAVRLVAVKVVQSADERRRTLEALRASIEEGERWTRRRAQPGLPLRRGWPAQVIALDTSALMAILLNEPEGTA